MNVLFSCKNHCQDFSKSEQELTIQKTITRCSYCGEKLYIENLQEIVLMDIKKKIKNNVDTYIKELGLEGAWELIERNKTHAGANLYFEEFKRRGINLK